MDVSQKNTILIVGLLGLVSALIGPHPLPTILSIVSLGIVVGLFLKLRNPVFLTILFALSFQWLQINIKLIFGNIVGTPITEMFSFYKDDDFLYEANILSNIGLMFFSFGIYLPFSKYYKNLDIRLVLDSKYDSAKVVRNYIIFSLGIAVLLGFRNSLPGINTVVTAFSKLKWGFLVVAFLYSHIYNRKKRLLYSVIAFEILLGFTGYFSGFKDFIIILSIGLLSLQFSIDAKAISRFSFIFIIGLTLGLVWSAIKMDYREFLAGGEYSQRVVVSKTEAISEMGNQLEDLTLDDVYFATDALLDRISYIEFFSITLRYVPDYIPYQKGEIITESTTFYFKPRIFFPDKAVIDDSDHTNKYTRLNLMSDGKASHSIGFMTDAYIDFGPIGMMFLLLGLGLVFGFSMNLLLVKTASLFWGIIFIIPFYFLLSVYSFNMIKVMGNFITYIVPVYFLRNIIIKRLDKYFL